jgi:ABC-type Na+ efflux pump permease subunit
MRQGGLIVLGLVLCATGAQGFIRLIFSHNPGALRLVPGGFAVHLVVYLAIFVFGLTMARRNKVNADPDHDRHR